MKIVEEGRSIINEINKLIDDNINNIHSQTINIVMSVSEFVALQQEILKQNLEEEIVVVKENFRHYYMMKYEGRVINLYNEQTYYIESIFS